MIRFTTMHLTAPLLRPRPPAHSKLRKMSFFVTAPGANIAICGVVEPDTVPVAELEELEEAPEEKFLSEQPAVSSTCACVASKEGASKILCMLQSPAGMGHVVDMGCDEASI